MRARSSSIPALSRIVRWTLASGGWVVCTQRADGQLVPHKRIDLIVETFNATPQRKLIVIGDGPEMAAIRAKAGPNVESMLRGVAAG